jgi:hypothetical protein
VEESGLRTFVRNVVNPTIDTSCRLSAAVNVSGLGAGNYEAHVVAYSGATIATQEFIGGIALPSPGIMILKQ